jgi:hypothetical protein
VVDVIKLLQRLKKPLAMPYLIEEKVAFEAKFRPDPSLGLAYVSFRDHEAAYDYTTAWIAHAPFRKNWNIPKYLRSLDAGRTLILPNTDWIISDVNGHMGGTPFAQVGQHYGYSYSVEVALVIAALLDRAAI